MSTQDRNSLPPEASLSDAQFDAYLRRDSQVSQQYRSTDSETVPPPSLDRAVLSQAHAAAAATKRSRLVRWSGPLALAASVVVVVSLVFEPTMQKEISQSAMPATVPKPVVRNESSDSAMRESQPLEMKLPQVVGQFAPDENDSRHLEPQQASTAASGATPIALEALANEAERKATAKAQDSSDQMENVTSRAAPPKLEMPVDGRQTIGIAVPAAPPPASAAPSLDRSESAGAAAIARNDAEIEEAIVTHAQSANEAVGPRGTVSMQRARNAAVEQSMTDKKIEAAAPAAWLERIRNLRRAGRQVTADREWQRFVKQYPDYAVDAADLARPQR